MLLRRRQIINNRLYLITVIWVAVARDCLSLVVVDHAVVCTGPDVNLSLQ